MAPARRRWPVARFSARVVDEDVDVFDLGEVADDLGVDPGDGLEFSGPVLGVVGPGDPGGGVGGPLGGHAVVLVGLAASVLSVYPLPLYWCKVFERDFRFGLLLVITYLTQATNKRTFKSWRPEDASRCHRLLLRQRSGLRLALNYRWPNGLVACPRCGSERHAFIKSRRIWECYGCKKQFSLKVGTIFEDSALTSISG